MTALATPSLLTAEEFLALPENGTERWLIQGHLREKRMTVRNRWHSRVLIRIGKFLDNWLDQQPEPRGQVLGGEAGVRLRHDPDTIVGIDVVYISADLAARQPEDTTLIDGVPVLVVEILSPTDMLEHVEEKIDGYLAAGVPLIWVINPYRRTIQIFQPGTEPKLATVAQDLSAEPHLPGFRVPVIQLFA